MTERTPVYRSMGQAGLQLAGTEATANDTVDLRRHIPALDGLRGLAILLVMIHHQCVMQAETSFDHLVLRPMQFGFCGVDLFFVLSGFLITGILLDTKGGRRRFVNFYGRRVLRILPLYYAVVVVSLVILPQFSHPKIGNFARITGDEMWYWLHLSNFSIAHHGAWRHGILDISWSLAIEEQFYLVWPLLVFYMPRRKLIATCCILILASLVFRTGLFLGGVQPIANYVLPFCRVDALAVGALIAALARERPSALASLVKPAKQVAVVSGLGIIAIMVFGLEDGWRTAVMLTAGFSLLAVFFGASLVLTVNAAPTSLTGRVFGSAFLRWLGKYSYALYLFHLPLRAVVRDNIYGPDQFLTWMGSQFPGQLIFFVLSFAITLPIAWLSWHLYEKHFLKLKSFFEYDERTSGAEITDSATHLKKSA